MNAVNSVIAKLVALMLAPFEHAPLTGLIVIGLGLGVVAAVCFRFTSNQKALRRVADSSRANLLTLWLFRDEIGVALRAIGGLLGAALARLALSLPPLLVMLVPFGLLLTHMATDLINWRTRSPRPIDALSALRACHSPWAETAACPTESLRE